MRLRLLQGKAALDYSTGLVSLLIEANDVISHISYSPLLEYIALRISFRVGLMILPMGSRLSNLFYHILA